MFSVLFATFIVLIVLVHKIRSYYWVNRGVPGPKPWPVVGNIAEHMFGRKTIGQVITDIYRKYDHYPVVGIFRALTPCLLVRDLEFINNILVKDHKAFYNNEFFVDKKHDPLMGHNLFTLRDHEWKDTRHMLTPGFTGGKMRRLFPLIHGVSEKLVNFIANHPDASDDGIETKDLTKRYTLDNVATVAFGFDSKSFEHYRNSSKFMELANRCLATGSDSAFLFQLNAVLPIIGRFLNVKLVPKDVEDQLVQIVSDVINYRKQNPQMEYNDFLQFLIEVSKGKHLSCTDMTAYGVMFLFDGYETASMVLGYVLLNLAQKPQYQAKIREELRRVGDEISLETLTELHWTEACLYETFRLNPIFDNFTKICSQPYEYTTSSPDFKKMHLKLYPGDRVIIPYGSISKDEKYFQNAHEFLPERMMDKDGISKLALFPFGAGPRACIGQRFALMELKVGLAQIIKHYQVSLSPKTKLPLRLKPFRFFNQIDETFRLNPIFDNFTKICSQPYEYTTSSPDFKKMHLKLYPGDRVIIPYGSISKDEKYFQNAHEFLPERMMDKDGISKLALFPFGAGPRACIGQRFALMELKVGLAQIIKHYQVSLSPKTKLPLRLKPFRFFNQIDGELWLRFKQIT